MWRGAAGGCSRACRRPSPGSLRWGQNEEAERRGPPRGRRPQPNAEASNRTARTRARSAGAKEGDRRRGAHAVRAIGVGPCVEECKDHPSVAAPGCDCDGGDASLRVQTGLVGQVQGMQTAGETPTDLRLLSRPPCSEAVDQSLQVSARGGCPHVAFRGMGAASPAGEQRVPAGREGRWAPRQRAEARSGTHASRAAASGRASSSGVRQRCTKAESSGGTRNFASNGFMRQLMESGPPIARALMTPFPSRGSLSEMASYLTRRRRERGETT